MGGDPWVYDKTVHSNNTTTLIQLPHTVALNKATHSGVGGGEWQNRGKLIERKIYLVLFNWIIGEGKLAAFVSSVT